MSNQRKKIARFVFVPNKGLWIDLQDKVMAVRITPNEGDILIAEGDGPDRLDRVCIPGKTVIEFECQKFLEAAEIRVWFNATDGKDWHLIGETDDFAHANKWVERVNEIYQKRRGHGDNLNREQKNPGLVIRDIERTGETNVLPGDFVYSAENDPPIVKPGDYLYSGGLFPQTGLPAWQDLYVKSCLDEAIIQTDFKKPIKVKIGNSPIHDYAWLADRVKYPSVEAHVRITQPLEIMFDCKERHDKIGVVPFCSLPRFALVYVRGQEIQNILNLRPGDLGADSFDEWITKVGNETLRNEKVRICVPFHQTIQYPLKDAVFRNRVDQCQLTIKQTPNEMAQWLYDNSKLGVIACDIGVFYQIWYDMKRNNNPLSDKVDHSLVPYERVLKGGFCYRADDTKWGAICIKSFNACLSSKDGDVMESLVEFQTYSKKVGIEFLLPTD